MPTRKTPPPDEPEDAAAGAAATPDAVAPAADPPGDDQEEVTLPDGSTGVVDKAFAEALKAAQAKAAKAKSG